MVAAWLEPDPAVCTSQPRWSLEVQAIYVSGVRGLHHTQLGGGGRESLKG